MNGLATQRTPTASRAMHVHEPVKDRSPALHYNQGTSEALKETTFLHLNCSLDALCPLTSRHFNLLSFRLSFSFLGQLYTLILVEPIDTKERVNQRSFRCGCGEPFLQGPSRVTDLPKHTHLHFHSHTVGTQVTSHRRTLRTVHLTR